MTGGFFAILDDIGVLLDDTAAMSKVAVQKTAGVLWDDLAVNAEKAAGFHTSRELPVLWAITKGSFRNKLILLPLAFLLSAFSPSWIIPILLIGGIYLSFEGAEKFYDYFSPSHHQHKPLAQTVENEKDLLVGEDKKIKSAILTDFILSIEIIVIALGTVAMLLVGGGIFVHNIQSLHHALDFLPILVAELSSGLAVGFIVLGVEKVLRPLFHKAN